MKKSETQEQEFLEVCSSYDHDLLTGKREMTLKDYERITYLVSSLGYSQYLQFLIGKYMDLAQADEERGEREHERNSGSAAQRQPAGQRQYRARAARDGKGLCPERRADGDGAARESGDPRLHGLRRVREAGTVRVRRCRQRAGPEA